MTEPNPDTSARQPIDLRTLLLLLLGAAVLRLAFFNGFFGSDDLTYLNRALESSEGVWSSADYNGALRYGFNLPAGAMLALLGRSEIGAAAWPFLCSLLEVALVYALATRALGPRVGLFAGLIIACTPLHIALGTRVHADAVVACFLTLGFVLLYAAEQTRSALRYLAAGLAFGMVFWVKELAAVTFVAVATYPLRVRRVDPRWLWGVVGALAMLAAHLALMAMLSGDPWHLFSTVFGQMHASFIEGAQGEDAPGYYLRYLFLDLRHSWLLGPSAVLGLVAAVRARQGGEGTAVAYVAWWLASLLLVLSVLPVSLDPLRFPMKQSNYLALFIAPLAILAAYGLARLPRGRIAGAVVALVLLGGIGLGALEQAAYRGFNANSRAAIAFARAHPSALFIGSTANRNLASITSLLDGDEDLVSRFGYLDGSPSWRFDPSSMDDPQRERYAVLDRESIGWGSHDLATDLPLGCWREVMRLTPTGAGLSVRIIALARGALSWLPGGLGARIDRVLAGLAEPAPARVYRIEGPLGWCGEVQPGAGVGADAAVGSP